MIALWIVLAAQAATPLGSAPLADPILAEQRGGFRLPNGIDVAISVQTQTVLDGAVVLRTVFRADQGAPTLTILAPPSGQTVAAQRDAGGASTTQGTSMPSVTYDRNSGIQVMPGVTTPQVSISSGAGSSTGAADGLVPVAAGATTDNGVVSTAATDGLRTVTLSATDLTITHIAGNAFGSAILNSGSDRAIDTQTAVSINLSNAGPDVLGSAMFRVQDVAIAAASLRVN